MLEAGKLKSTNPERDNVLAGFSFDKSSAVPGHAEINDYLARKICNDLGVPAP